MRTAQDLRNQIAALQAKAARCKFASARKIHEDKAAFLRGELVLQENKEKHGVGFNVRAGVGVAPSCHFCGAEFYESPDWEAEAWRCQEYCDTHPEGLLFCAQGCRDAAHGIDPRPATPLIDVSIVRDYGSEMFRAVVFALIFGTVAAFLCDVLITIGG